MRKLVDSLHKMLFDFKAKAAAKPGNGNEGAGTPAAGHETHEVFFADVADSLREVRARVMKELDRKDVRVISHIPPPYEVRPHQERVVKAIKNTALSVHLLDQFAGREIAGEPHTSYPRKQVELAKTHARAQVIWVRKDFAPQAVEEESYRNFLDQLENGERQGADYDFIRGMPADLAAQILEKLKHLQAAPETSPTTPAVLVDTHRKDELHALNLYRFLLENNIKPFLNPWEDGPARNIDMLETRLKQVDTLIILFGSVQEIWVQERLGLAQQLAKAKNYPLQNFCVYLVPPEKRLIEFKLPIPVYVIDNSKGQAPDPNAFAPVLRRLQRGGTA
jgi:hypothetical protein